MKLNIPSSIRLSPPTEYMVYVNVSVVLTSMMTENVIWTIPKIMQTMFRIARPRSFFSISLNFMVGVSLYCPEISFYNQPEGIYVGYDRAFLMFSMRTASSAFPIRDTMSAMPSPLEAPTRASLRQFITLPIGHS